MSSNKRKKSSGKKWTEAEVEKMLKLKVADHSWKQISALLGRSVHSCQQKLKEMKIRDEDPRAILVTRENKTKNSVVNDYWTEDDLIKLYELRKAGVPYKEIARELERSVDSVQSKYRRTKWHQLPFYDSNKKLEDKAYQAKISKVREKVSSIADRKYENHKMATDIIADALSSAVLPYNKVSPPKSTNKRKRKKSKKKYKDEDVVLILSDIHIGAEHSFEETGGLAEFNSQVLSDRIQNLKYAVRDIHHIHSQVYKLPQLHIACLGDIVAGQNEAGEWSHTHITMSIADQVAQGWEMLSSMVHYWLSIFDKITFYGVRGNHGRVAKKGVEKDYANWDYISYLFLKTKFANEPRINFVIPKSWWIIEQIKGHNFLMVHGDDVKAKSRPVKSLLEFSDKMVGMTKKIPDYTLAGHYHNSSELTTNNGRVIINGSVIGGDVYSLKNVHAISRPEQTIFGVHEDHGITWKYNMDLDHDRDPD